MDSKNKSSQDDTHTKTKNKQKTDSSGAKTESFTTDSNMENKTVGLEKLEAFREDLYNFLQCEKGKLTFYFGEESEKIINILPHSVFLDMKMQLLFDKNKKHLDLIECLKIDAHRKLEPLRLIKLDEGIEYTFLDQIKSFLHSLNNYLTGYKAVWEGIISYDKTSENFIKAVKTAENKIKDINKVFLENLKEKIKNYESNIISENNKELIKDSLNYLNLSLNLYKPDEDTNKNIKKDISTTNEDFLSTSDVDSPIIDHNGIEGLKDMSTMTPSINPSEVYLFETGVSSRNNISLPFNEIGLKNNSDISTSLTNITSTGDTQTSTGLSSNISISWITLFAVIGSIAFIPVLILLFFGFKKILKIKRTRKYKKIQEKEENILL